MKAWLLFFFLLSLSLPPSLPFFQHVVCDRSFKAVEKKESRMSSKEPYTERPNGLTENIDKIGNARCVVRLLKAVDAQLFGGYIGEHPGLGDFETAKVGFCGRGGDGNKLYAQICLTVAWDFHCHDSDARPIDCGSHGDDIQCQGQRCCDQRGRDQRPNRVFCCARNESAAGPSGQTRVHQASDSRKVESADRGVRLSESHHRALPFDSACLFLQKGDFITIIKLGWFSFPVARAC